VAAERFCWGGERAKVVRPGSSVRLGEDRRQVVLSVWERIGGAVGGCWGQRCFSMEAMEEKKRATK
jgi:hypothetical protein